MTDDARRQDRIARDDIFREAHQRVALSWRIRLPDADPRRIDGHAFTVDALDAYRPP